MLKYNYYESPVCVRISVCVSTISSVVSPAVSSVVSTVVSAAVSPATTKAPSSESATSDGASDQPSLSTNQTSAETNCSKTKDTSTKSSCTESVSSWNNNSKSTWILLVRKFLRIPPEFLEMKFGLLVIWKVWKKYPELYAIEFYLLLYRKIKGCLVSFSAIRTTSELIRL